MLVIRRKEGESVLVGDAISVQVLEISSNRVKLGFVAPTQVTVTRLEVFLARQQNRAAASAAPLPEDLRTLAHTLRQDF